ncbi:hypothetical protein CLU83_1923 [Flavobacterium sp. 1]|nr:hypothetical protein CLU83_1923 [Flavobacterium sp. 1]
MLLKPYIRLKKTDYNKQSNRHEKIRKVIKFYCDEKSKLFISSYLSLSRNTAKKYISLSEVLGLLTETGNLVVGEEIKLYFDIQANH